MATGGGHCNMKEIVSLLNISSPDKDFHKNRGADRRCLETNLNSRNDRSKERREAALHWKGILSSKASSRVRHCMVFAALGSLKLAIVVYIKLLSIPSRHTVECANRAIRCYRKSLHDLVDAHPEWKGQNVWRPQEVS